MQSSPSKEGKYSLKNGHDHQKLLKDDTLKDDTVFDTVNL